MKEFTCLLYWTLYKQSIKQVINSSNYKYFSCGELEAQAVSSFTYLWREWERKYLYPCIHYEELMIMKVPWSEQPV
jgi:hypothetical protein